MKKLLSLCLSIALIGTGNYSNNFGETTITARNTHDVTTPPSSATATIYILDDTDADDKNTTSVVTEAIVVDDESITSVVTEGIDATDESITSVVTEAIDATDENITSVVTEAIVADDENITSVVTEAIVADDENITSVVTEAIVADDENITSVVTEAIVTDDENITSVVTEAIVADDENITSVVTEAIDVTLENVTTAVPDETMKYEYIHPQYNHEVRLSIKSYSDADHSYIIEETEFYDERIIISILRDGVTTLETSSILDGISYLTTIWAEDGIILKTAENIKISLPGDFTPSRDYTIFYEPEFGFEEMCITATDDGKLISVVCGKNKWVVFNYIIGNYKYIVKYEIADSCVVGTHTSIHESNFKIGFENEIFEYENSYNVLVFSPATYAEKAFPTEYNITCHESNKLYIPAEYGEGEYTAYIVSLGVFVTFELDCYGNITVK